MKPLCPKCQHQFTIKELNALLKSLKDKRVRVRSNARPYEAMPLIISVLRERGELTRPILREIVKRLLKEREYTCKNEPIDFALTYLKKAGYIHQPSWAKWMLTQKGIDSKLDEKTSKEITNSIEKQYHKVK